MLELLPKECDILCTHPMFGPDSGRYGWQNLNFVYEKTRIDQVLLDSREQQQRNGSHFVEPQTMSTTQAKLLWKVWTG